MKSAEERAKEYSNLIPLGCVPFKKDIERVLVHVIKETDKITRHACCDSVNEINKICDRESSCRAIMNTKSV